MFHVDPTDPTPPELQLARSIRSAIRDQLLAAGETLPTVRQLAVELRVNANAVETAYRELTGAGVLEQRAGIGVVVADPAEDPAHPQRLAELVALEDEFLRRASALGFSRDEVIIHLHGRPGE